MDPGCGVKSLARLVRLSVSRLEHLFKQKIGITISSYRSHLRLGLAANMLETGEASIKEIAYELGFGRSTSFTRFFKAVRRDTPTQYRMRCFIADLASLFPLT